MNKYLINKKYKQKHLKQAKLLGKITGWGWRQYYLRKFYLGLENGFRKSDRQFLHDNKSGFEKIVRSHKRYNQKVLKKCLYNSLEDEFFEYKYRYCQMYYW